MTGVLTDLMEYLDDRADVKDTETGPIPDSAMRLMMDLEIFESQIRYVLLPYLRRQSDAGWPGVSERDRNELSNMLADLRAEFEVER